MKKLLSLLLTLAMLFSLAVPALAAEAIPEDAILSEDAYDEEVYEETPYDRGYNDGWEAGLEAGYAEGKADAQARTPKQLSYSESLWSEEATYDDGYTEGYTDGRCSGYDDGYLEACGRFPSDDQTVLDKGGVPGQVNVMMDGTCLSFPDAVPTIVDGRTMIPVRAVMEALEAQVDYDKAGKVVLISKEDITVSFVIGSSSYSVITDGAEAVTKEMDCAPYITRAEGESRTMVPLRFLTEAFGYAVLWDDSYNIAVVVDDEALIAQVDSKFTYINDILASQLQQQAGQKYKQTDTLTGSLTLYDEDGKEILCPFSASSTAYTDGVSSRVDMTFDIRDTLLTLCRTHPELLEDISVNLRTALETDPSAITLTLLMTEDGGMYLQMPLLNTMSQDLRDDTWLELADLGDYGVDLTELETTAFTLGQLIVPTLLTDEVGIAFWDTLDLTVAILESVYGDAAAQVDGDTYTWTMDAADLAGSLGDEALDEETLAALESFSLAMTMGKDGSYAITSVLDLPTFLGDIFFDLDASGSMEGGTLSMALGLEGLFELSLDGKTTIETVRTLPDLTLPEGAVVEDMAGLTEGGYDE